MPVAFFQTQRPLEKFYIFARLLVSKLHEPNYGERLKLDDDVALQYYRLTKTSDASLVLAVHPEYPLNPTTEAELLLDETLKQQTQTNSIENFRYGFQEKLDNTMIDRMDANREIFQKVMESEEIKGAVMEEMLKQVYKKFNDASKL